MPFNDNVPVPASTPDGAVTRSRAAVTDSSLFDATGVSLFKMPASSLLASVVRELKENRLDTATTSSALNSPFEFNFCIVNPPRKPGRPSSVLKHRKGIPRLWQTALPVNTFQQLACAAPGKTGTFQPE